MDEKFSCPNCGQHIAIANPAHGAAIQCPGCRQNFNLPVAGPAGRRSANLWLMLTCALLLVVVAVLGTLFVVKRPAQPPPEPPPPAQLQISRAAPSRPALPVPSQKPLVAWIDELASTDVKVREQSRTAIRMMGRAALPEILRLIDDKNPQSKRKGYAIEALGCAGSPDGPEVQLLLKLAKDDYYRNRTIALTALRRLGVDTTIIVPLFTEMLGDENAKVRRSAAMNLGFMGGVSREALSALEKAANDEDQTVRDAANEAVRTILKTRPAAPKSPAPEQK